MWTSKKNTRSNSRNHLNLESLESRKLMTVVGEVHCLSIDTDDIIPAFQAGKYETGMPATPAEGDWNEDGFFDSADLIFALQNPIAEPTFELNSNELLIRANSQMANHLRLDGTSDRLTVSFRVCGEWHDREFQNVPRVRLIGSPFDDTFRNDSTVPSVVFGGYGRDVLIGGPAVDVLHGQGGNDVIRGRGGRDELYGGDQNDRIHGGRDGDFIDGGNHRDRLFGGAGGDEITGGDGDDRIYGGRGHDVLWDHLGNDALFGNAGNDQLTVSLATGTQDYMNGGKGNNRLFAIGALGGDPQRVSDPFGQRPAALRDSDLMQDFPGEALRLFLIDDEWIAQSRNGSVYGYDELARCWIVVDSANLGNFDPERDLGFDYNVAPQGHLDSVDNVLGTLQGWAYDPDAPVHSIALHIYESGEFVGEAIANLERPDVNQAEGITGNHGFVWNIPARYHDGAPHTFEVFALDTSGGHNPLIGTATYDFENRAPVGWLGGIDAASSSLVGWTYDPNAPSHSIDVHIYEMINGAAHFAGHTTANHSRPDVNNVHGVPGDHGFVWNVPCEYHNGQPHTFAAFGLDTSGGHNPELNGSPIVFQTDSDASIENSFINAGIVSLQTLNGHYLVAEGGGGRELLANRSQVGAWEKFRVIPLGGPNVALQASNGQYVSAEGGGGSTVFARAPWIREWETFEVVGVCGKIALRTPNGQFLSANHGGGSDVSAGAPWSREWEQFTFRSYADSTVDQFVRAGTISLQTISGHYLVAEGGGGREIRADRTQAREWEQFRVVPLGGNQVALQAVNGQYVSADGGGGGDLYARAPWIREWETFEVVGVGDGMVALRTYNGHFLSAQNGGGSSLLANAPWAREWETLRFHSA